MGKFQSQFNSVIGAGAALSAANKMSTKKESISSKDIEMAKKARRVAQDKINAIYLNKELSNKARTRRMGKILDEYKGGK